VALVHRREQVGVDVVALECHACGMRYVGPEIDEILAFDELRCPDPECGAGGMIARKASRLEERFPDALARRFTPLPDALMDQACALGLGPNELLVIWALERHRRLMGDVVFPSHRKLANLTRLSVPTVKRALAKLVKAELIEQQPHFRADGGRTTSQYNLDGLWQALATHSSHRPTHSSHRPTHSSHRPRGEGAKPPELVDDIPFDLGGIDHTDPGPQVTQTHQEVDVVVEVDAVPEGDLVSTRTAPRPLAATQRNLRRNPDISHLGVDTAAFLAPKPREAA
jgi:hypothetical protein